MKKLARLKNGGSISVAGIGTIDGDISVERLTQITDKYPQLADQFETYEPAPPEPFEKKEKNKDTNKEGK